MKPNDYWVEIKDAKEICGKLELAFHVPSYYRRVKVWLPDIQYNIMPNCPMCGKCTHVGAHSFRVYIFREGFPHWIYIGLAYRADISAMTATQFILNKNVPWRLLRNSLD
jgi:hypothetical protein